MRNVVFVAPFPMETTLRFARAAKGLDGVRLLGVFQRGPGPQDADLFHHVQPVANAMDAAHIAQGIEALANRFGPIHRIVGVLEELQVQLAQVRSHFGIRGLSVKTAERFRDKATMKEVLRSAGIPCARHRLIACADDAWGFANEVGFPMVLKPPAGAGCRATYKLEGPEALSSALQEIEPSANRVVLAEEFLTGREYSFETLTIGGQPRFHSISRYLPTPLEVMRNPWIQWVCLLPRDISGPTFDRARQVALKAIDALGLDTAMTHMEWFERPDGSIAVGEIAARPPGAQIVPLMSLVHGTDLYRGCARAVVDDAFDGPWNRQRAAGVAFLRGSGQGRVAAIEGLDHAQKQMGELVFEAKLPRIGAPKSTSYEGDGHVIVSHPDTAVVEEALGRLIQTVQVHYA